MNPSPQIWQSYFHQGAKNLAKTVGRWNFACFILISLPKLGVPFYVRKIICSPVCNVNLRSGRMNREKTNSRNTEKNGTFPKARLAFLQKKSLDIEAKRSFAPLAITYKHKKASVEKWKTLKKTNSTKN